MKPFALIVLFAASSAVMAQPAPRLEAALRAFWEADSPSERTAAVERVLAAETGFDAIVTRLRAGRDYKAAPTGSIEMRTTVNRLSLDNVVEVPADYTPTRTWRVRVSLHGGVGREAPAGGERPRPLTNRTPAGSEIVIHPRAWATAEWWTPAQVDNVLRLLDRVKREYNVDESRVYVTGISDGGTGVYFLGMREATPWSACLTLNGHPSVLANPDVGADGQLYAGNLSNCPLYIVNGGRDRLYPASSVTPFVEMFKKGGVPLVFNVHPEAGHDVSWWPEERPRYEQFLAAHPRIAHPERITWETERTDRYNRFRWLVIDKIGARPSDVALPDVNHVSLAAREVPLYDRDRPSGRADAARNGNGFELKTRGVHELTLLLSPDVVDFSRPVRVVVNGRVVHEAIVPPDATTVLEWAAKDNDRTMLYGAALKVVVP